VKLFRIFCQNAEYDSIFNGEPIEVRKSKIEGIVEVVRAARPELIGEIIDISPDISIVEQLSAMYAGAEVERIA